jgi:hypothetical protein
MSLKNVGGLDGLESRREAVGSVKEYVIWLVIHAIIALPYENIIMRKKIIQISRRTYQETMPAWKQ